MPPVPPMYPPLPLLPHLGVHSRNEGLAGHRAVRAARTAWTKPAPRLPATVVGSAVFPGGDATCRLVETLRLTASVRGCLSNRCGEGRPVGCTRRPASRVVLNASLTEEVFTGWDYCSLSGVVYNQLHASCLSFCLFL